MNPRGEGSRLTAPPPTRSAKKCEGVLCAYRQMIYGMEDAWSKHIGDCEGRWHFSTKEGKKGDVATFVVGGEEIPVEKLIEGMLEVICSTIRMLPTLPPLPPSWYDTGTKHMNTPHHGLTSSPSPPALQSTPPSPAAPCRSRRPTRSRGSLSPSLYPSASAPGSGLLLSQGAIV